jgi:pimeloyl-ACP methyl ester carboxylesterase
MHRAVRRGVLTGGLLATLLASVVAPGTALAARRPPPPVAVKAPPVVKQAPCADSIFICITIRVPRDHFASSGPTVDVTFALHRAKAKTRKGVFVTVTGGPGTSGIAAADSYTELFDPDIVRDYDIVFLDQRGIGQSQPFQCPDASLAFYTSPNMPTLGNASALAYAHDARTYAAECIDEGGIDPGMLPYFATRQAVEDLEAFRVWLKADKIDLYGESYGTQYVQTYANAHPTRLKSLMIDGPVDLTLTGFEYYDEQTDAFDDVLSMTLDRCTDDAACRRDVVGRNGLAGYDQLAARLRNGPLAYSFVDATGHLETRSFGLGDLETAAAGYVYGEFDRMLLQRAIAWASRGQLLPLARLAYISLAQDPETLAAIPDDTWSDAMFYGVECMDYDYGPGTGEQRAQRYITAGNAADVAHGRVGSIFYGDMPCAYWPARPPTPARPDYLTDTPYPVFVLASTTDPATPYAGALRIMSHLTDGYLLIHPGGPHIIFGRENACPDDDITAFLVDGVRPGTRFITCDFTGTDPYVSIPAAKVKDYRDALAAMTAMDDEINYSADYWNWDGVDPLAYGCLFDGSIEYTAFRNGYKAALDDCEFTDGLPLTGNATIDTTRNTFVLKVTGPSATNLEYKRDAKGKTSVTGTYFGKPASMAGQAAAPARQPRR